MVVLLYGLLIFFGLLLIIYFFTCGLFNQYGTVNASWSSPYECGFSPSSLSFNCFSFTYFSLLVFFVIFDLEISLLLNMPEQGILNSNFFYYYFFYIYTGNSISIGVVFSLCSLGLLSWSNVWNYC